MFEYKPKFTNNHDGSHGCNHQGNQNSRTYEDHGAHILSEVVWMTEGVSKRLQREIEHRFQGHQRKEGETQRRPKWLCYSRSLESWVTKRPSHKRTTKVFSFPPPPHKCYWSGGQNVLWFPASNLRAGWGYDFQNPCNYKPEITRVIYCNNHWNNIEIMERRSLLLMSAV